MYIWCTIIQNLTFVTAAVLLTSFSRLNRRLSLVFFTLIRSWFSKIIHENLAEYKTFHGQFFSYNKHYQLSVVTYHQFLLHRKKKYMHRIASNRDLVLRCFILAILNNAMYRCVTLFDNRSQSQSGYITLHTTFGVQSCLSLL